MGGEEGSQNHRTLPSPVCEWGYDEPVGAAQKFILVYESHIRDANPHLVRISVKIESALSQPLEVGRALDVHVTLKCNRYMFRQG